MKPHSKTCVSCLEYLPMVMFYADRYSSDGRQGTCKDCQKARHRGKGVREINKLLKAWDR